YSIISQHHFAGIRRREAKDSLRQFRAPGPDESCQSEDFTTSNRERNIVKPSRSVSHVAKFKDNLPGGYLAFRENRNDLAPHNHADELRPVHLSFALRTNGLTVAQHGYAVRDSRNLLETVRDVNDPNAATA